MRTSKYRPVKRECKVYLTLTLRSPLSSSGSLSESWQSFSQTRFVGAAVKKLALNMQVELDSVLAVRDNLENEVERLAAESMYVKQKAEEYSTELRALLEKVREAAESGHDYAFEHLLKTSDFISMSALIFGFRSFI
jgi:uncharacterized membrane-anchored protein